MTSVLGIISVAFSVLMSVVAITAVIVQMRMSVEALEKFEIKQSAKDERTTKDLTELLVLIKSFMAEQSVINHTVTEALSSVVHKLEDAEKKISETEHKSIESTMLVNLLADLLKRKGCFFNLAPVDPQP